MFVHAALGCMHADIIVKAVYEYLHKCVLAVHPWRDIHPGYRSPSLYHKIFIFTTVYSPTRPIPCDCNIGSHNMNRAYRTKNCSSTREHYLTQTIPSTKLCSYLAWS